MKCTLDELHKSKRSFNSKWIDHADQCCDEEEKQRVKKRKKNTLHTMRKWKENDTELHQMKKRFISIHGLHFTLARWLYKKIAKWWRCLLFSLFLCVFFIPFLLKTHSLFLYHPPCASPMVMVMVHFIKYPTGCWTIN